ncbi:hypothetical protein [Rhizobium laguerreae]|uniref:hypothetical protein n=1 Tax=Rhizobium laguerreae TaxID=1076926 RepID=UPI001C92B9B9|nr:hypothetical protein [Rhizobium laguerreae]MBY3222295.1 hypothetical protein [Rhizobium laguerreae]
MPVYRNFNEDYSRKGDEVYEGLFGINQRGYDAPVLDLGRTSAGCLVGRSVEGHKEFMGLLKADPRYLASNGYRFIATIIEGSKALG